MATDLKVSPILGKQKSKGGRPLNSIWEDINKGESVGSATIVRKYMSKILERQDKVTKKRKLPSGQ
ncbi:hypothetical protein RhiirA5_444274 [Rhizophagus irregularis]|uniref:Uncharacterized protein n=1 Tax=Rhizophagus irregularis TaxID=588596 RepID=A0A2N0ND88_9GLOM|nr:hypothetical protein RhiirA5_444274 [Rhizophagus irregularis]